MIALLGKYLETIQISIAENLAYRFNFLLEFSGPALVYFIIKYNVWTGVYGGADSDLVLRGFSLAEMLEYQSWTLIVYLITQSYNGASSAIDIRLGRISAFLLYPFGFFEYHFGRFIGFFLLQTVIAISTASLFMLSGMIGWVSLQAIAAGFLMVLAAALYWFLWNFLTSIVAFWLDETWFLRVIMILLVRLLSGSLIPLDFFPDTAVAFLKFTPFPYLTYYPVRVLQGDLSLFAVASMSLLGWIVLLMLMNRIVWGAGVKRYSAAGM